MFEQVDKIYCLSLKRRTDRRESFSAQSKQVGFDFQFWDAVDAQDFKLLGFKPFFIEKHWITFSKGYYCQNLSMMQIFLDAKKNNYKNILVFEDDAVFIEDFDPSIFDTCWKQIHARYTHFDLIYLGGKHMEKPYPIAGYEGFLKPTKTYEAHAVVYSNRVMDRILSCLRRNNMVYDHWLFEIIQPLGLTFCLPKDICFQYDNFSDGLEKMVKNKYQDKNVILR